MSATSLLLSLKNNKDTQSPFFLQYFKTYLLNSCDGFHTIVVEKGECFFLVCLLNFFGGRLMRYGVV